MTKKSVTERELVMECLLEITRDGQYSHIALRNLLSKYQYLDKKERAFITRCVEGTLEHMIEIDYIIGQFSKVKVNKMKPVIRTIARSSVYQLKYMDSVPDSAVCNEAVKLAVKKGFVNLKGFVNGLLRNIARNIEQIEYPDEDTPEGLSVRYSMPQWILKLWLDEYDIETVKVMLEDFLKEKPTVIRCCLSQMPKEVLIEKLQAEHVTVKEHPYLPYALSISGYDYLEALESFREGGFYVQDIGSMLVAEVAGPKEGDQVIDVCAAPGGKALHIADKLAGTGMVEARDLTEAKVSLIEENIERAGLKNIRAVQKDASLPDEASVCRADIVVADLPCSGLGVLGRKTDLKYKLTEEMTEELSALQKKILTQAGTYVKPGGTLVYSTCTVNKKENEDNVRWFLEHFREFSLVKFDHLLTGTIKEEAGRDGTLQLLPGIHESDGFFIAKFKKAQASEEN